MRVSIALTFNVLLLALLVGWLRAQYRQAAPGLRRWLLPTLALRLAAGLFPHGPDSQFMSFWGQLFATQFWAQPSASWALWQGHELRAGAKIMKIYEWSNTLFTIKILGLLNLASLSSQWLTSCYFSLGCFVACWGLVRTLARLFPAAPVGAGVVAFLLWPSVVWWASGITKEALLLGSGTALIALFLQELYGEQPQHSWVRPGRWLLLGGLAWVHLRMRYFFALPLLGSLLALVSATLAERCGWLRARWPQLALVLLASLAVVGVLVVAVGGEPVSKAFVTKQLWGNYLHGIHTSPGRPHLVYQGLQPTVRSMASYFPLAAFQALVRPWLGESAAPLYLIAELENLLLAGLLVWAAVAVGRGRAGQLPPALVLALLLYCLVLAGLIGLSTPNLGTLHRYRAVLMPWLLWLLLQHDGARQLLRWLKIGD
jgi:hypothetical protein